MAKAPSKTAVAVAKSKLPAALDAEMAAEIEALKARLGAPGGDNIKVTQDKMFKLPNGDTSSELVCVIVEFVNNNTYYETGYVQGEFTPPVCFAIGANVADMAPSDNSLEKQHDKCSGCWANQFGSSGKGKACGNSKLLAVMAPDADTDTPLMVLKVSATALRPFDAYVGSVARAFQLTPRGVITRISFDPNVTYASLRFAPVEPCDRDLLMLAQSRKGEAMERLLTEPTYEVADEAAAPPPKAARGKNLKAPARRKSA